MNASTKPFGRKGYGSIPHLPNSRLGPGDWSIGPGQATILCEKKRDRHDRVIVTEKLDGSCVAIANIDGAIVPITRAGYHAADSHYLQHHLFGMWVMDRADQLAEVLPPGARIAGEWLAQAHGTRYLIAAKTDLFVAFDVLVGTDRWPHDEARSLFSKCDLRAAAVLSDGDAFPIDAAMAALGPTGHHGAWDGVEGAVWRCETRGAFNFIAKFVRPEKVDGKYLAGVSGGADVWNWNFDAPLEFPVWQEDAA